MNENWGSWIRSEREARHWTQSTLAYIAGLSGGDQVSRYERGTEPGADALAQLVGAFAAHPVAGRATVSLLPWQSPILDDFVERATRRYLSPPIWPTVPDQSELVPA